MITEAQRCGLKFKSDYANLPANADVMRADPDTFKNAISKRDKDGRLYDPRKGLGGYYRYGPRKLVPHFYRESHKLEEDEVAVERAKIHESVFRRIDNHAQAYAPVGLPPYYDVVKEDGEIVSPDDFRIEPDREPFETQKGGGATRAGAGARLERGLDAPHHLFRHRRRDAVAGDVPAPQQRADGPTNLPVRSAWVSDLVRFVGAFLPNFASTWIDGYARAPVWFMVMVGARRSSALCCRRAIASRTVESDGLDLAKNAACARRACRTTSVYRLAQQPVLHRASTRV